MISRSHRFHGLNSLRNVYSRGQTVRGSLFAIKYIFNNRRTTYRAAVVVSRKVHKSAVVRNRIRRRIYEWIRLHESAIVQPYDIVITIFSEAVAAVDAPALDAMLLEQFERAGLFGKPGDNPLTSQVQTASTVRGTKPGAKQGDTTEAGRAIVEQIAPMEQEEKH